ncbi:MAG: serine hydrolase [Acidobacteria bacterium]|nr:serine hydrolase [Acidobacteriota bacterium]
MRLVPALALLALLTAPLAAQRTDPKIQDLRGRLEATLERIASDLDGVMGYTIVDLTTGERLERLPDTVFATASTIKLSILYEMFRQAAEGRLKLDDVRILDRRHAVGGAGVLSQLTTPAMPLRDYATLMIVLSDNTATNVLIDAVGMENVTNRMSALGLKQTKLRRRMIDTEAALRGDENVSTPAEIARLLEFLHGGEQLTAANREELLGILQKPKSTPIHRGVPGSVPVASKSGSLDGVQVDAGIVSLPGRPYVFSVMVGYLKRPADGQDAIAAASQAAFDYFDRLARSSEFGRIVR